MNISYYNSLPSKGQPHLASGQFSIEEFISHIKFGKYKESVDRVRQEKDKDKRSALKRSLVSVTISGVFNERKETEMIAHSGFICIDVDNYTDKSAILKDKYTYSCFDSVSGNGFAVIVKVNPEKHKDSFRWLQKYYYDSFGIIVDPAPQNPASLRYVSYDPLIEINQKSAVAKTLVQKVTKPKSLPIILSDDKVDEYVKECQQRSVNIAPNYQDYLNLSFALVDGFGDSGRNYFHILCSVDEKYDSRHADKQYDIAIKRGKSGIGVGTFYFMLKQAGIEIKSDSGQAISIVAMGKKSGRTKEAITEQLITINQINPEVAANLVEQVFERDDINLKNLNADPEQLISSIMQWLDLNHPMRRNDITRIIESGPNEIKREDLNSIYLRCRSFFNTTDVTYDLLERIIFSNNTQSYNPISEYIEQNLYRRSSGNIDQIIKSIQTDTPNADIFIRKWLVSIIAAHKGYPVRSVLTLVGGQYTGKTEWFRRLLPDSLQKYYAESKLDAGKDDDLLMCQKLIVMDDEMGGKSKDDEKRFKELTSKAIFSLRAPYARANEDFKRLAILCGTSNSADIINDRTGNTRFLPVNVVSINHDLYNSVNKDELFMELFHLYDSKFEWKFTKSEFEILSEISQEFENINYENELILQFFRPASDGGIVEQMTATMIKNHIEMSSKQQIRNLKILGMELKKVFGKSRLVFKLGRVYDVIKVLDANSAHFSPQNSPQNVNLHQNSLSSVDISEDFDEDLPF